MEKDATNDLIYFLKIRDKEEEFLAPIRKWNDLGLAREKDFIWVRGFNLHQLESKEVQCIPWKMIFWEKDGKLYPFRSLLPHGRTPQLLWTPIQKALPVQVEQFNHNYFGVEEKIDIQLTRAMEEREGRALLVGMNDLQAYLEICSEVRLQNLYWTILGDKDALILGEPLLPLPGSVFWKEGSMYFPLGYNLELPFLAVILREKIEPNPDNYIFWFRSGNYLSIGPEDFKPLSLSSFRKTQMAHSETHVSN